MKKQLFTKQIAQLSLNNPAYRNFTKSLLELFFQSDLSTGDITTQLLTRPRQKIEAKIIAKQNCILAGLDEIEFFLRQNKIKTLTRKTDGSYLHTGETAAKISGSATAILTTERTTLNLIQRMSGIATTSNHLAKKIGVRKFAATRKTPLGLFDSRAVCLGGGLPHRLNLADQILIKNNHLSIEPKVWEKIHRDSSSTKTSFFEIEASSEKLACTLAKFFSKNKNFILLLDNFTPAKLKKIIPYLRKICPQIIIEASGNITTQNAVNFLNSGASFVSLGELTHSTPAIDFSLKISDN